MGIERDQTDSERRADEEAKELAFQQAYVCVIVMAVLSLYCGERLSSDVHVNILSLPLGLTAHCVPLCLRTSLLSRGGSSSLSTTAPPWHRGGQNQLAHYSLPNCL